MAQRISRTESPKEKRSVNAMNSKIGQAVMFLMILGAAAIMATAQRVDCKGHYSYENRNQVDYGPLVVRSISGLIFDDSDEPGDLLSIPGCVAIFTERSHRLVAKRAVGKNGRFLFRNLRPGNYRLVVRDPHNTYRLANAKIRVTTKALVKTLGVHMRQSGIDEYSYVSLD